MQPHRFHIWSVRVYQSICFAASKHHANNPYVRIRNQAMRTYLILETYHNAIENYITSFWKEDI